MFCGWLVGKDLSGGIVVCRLLIVVIFRVLDRCMVMFLVWFKYCFL